MIKMTRQMSSSAARTSSPPGIGWSFRSGISGQKNVIQKSGRLSHYYDVNSFVTCRDSEIFKTTVLAITVPGYLHKVYHDVHVNQLFLTEKSDQDPDPHWFGSLERGGTTLKKPDPDPYKSQWGSTTLF
jgi:hypothetical protein